jgi:HEAT repeat protein
MIGSFLLLGVAGGSAWVYRAELKCWYYLRGLASAGKDDRDSWIERLVELDSIAIPGLLKQLASANVQASANAEAALAYLARHWGAEDARTLELADQMADRFHALPPHGQEATLEWQLAQLQSGQAAPSHLVNAAVRLLTVSLATTEKGVRQRALVLAGKLLDSDPVSCSSICRDLVRRELKAPETLCRVQALHLLLHDELQKDTDLLKQAVPLLQDANALVRRAAVLALGLSRTTISEDELLPLLHDQDKGVCRLGELALKQRGLSDSHILLGKLITDPRPLARMDVLSELPYATDLDPGIWLQRLSQDSAEAVRAAAARAMCSYPIVALRTRLQQMAHDDPSPTVRQIAGAYLKLEE